MNSNKPFIGIRSAARISVAAIGLIVVVAAIAASIWVHSVNNLNAHWSEFEKGTEKKSAYLGLLRSTLGYGGIIHNLKNYVLRGDKYRLIRGYKSLLEQRIIINAYRNTEISDRENAALTTLENVINQYHNAFSRAEIFADKNYSPQNIDSEIMIDDRTALIAMQQLEQENFARRKDSIRSISVQVSDVTKNVIIVTIMFCIFLVFAGLIYAAFVRYQLTNPLTKLVTAFQEIDPANAQNIRLPFEETKWRSELDQVAEAGNGFLAAIDKQFLALEQSDIRVKAIVQNTSDAIVVIDSSGIIETFNNGAELIFGFSADEATGQSIDTLLDSEEHGTHDIYLKDPAKYMPIILNQARELKGRNKNGQLFPVELNVTSMTIGDELKYVGIMRDITDRKKYEFDLKMAKDEAESANHAKSEFLSSMSHELRTPMNTILGFGQLLEHNTSDPLTARQHDFIKQILNSGNHLLELIDQVLELSKIEAGKYDVNMEKIDAGNIIEECFIMLFGRASQESIDLVNQTKNMSLPKLYTDSSRFRQILLNLLSNAVKYNRKGGTVTLRAERLDDNMLRFLVIDTGLGIPKKEREKLFEPFNRLGRESGDIEGTGIGLSITNKLISLLDGRIGYESSEGVGSIFWFDLPIYENQVIGVEADSNRSQSENFLHQDIDELVDARVNTVLYIEDNLSSVQLMENIVQRLPNIDLLTATTGEAGINIADEALPDLILMDINLPGMTGIEAMQQLKLSPKTKNIPVIAVSAAVMPEEIRNAENAGFDQFISKPVVVEEILTAIAKVAD